MRKMTALLAAVVFMAALTVVQRLFLNQSDTGKEWALMAAWCWLYDWYLGAPDTRQSKAAILAVSLANTPGEEPNPEARNQIGLAARLSALDDSSMSEMPAENALSRPPEKRLTATNII